jgi:hypothetical protein
MAKKKGLAKYQANRKKRAVARKNPPLGTDLMKNVAPAFGAYVATRLVSRIVYQIVQRKWPKAGKHACAGSAVATFGAAFFAAHKVKRLEAHHDAIIVGSGIAAGQAVLRTYLPKYGWIVGDPKPEDVGQKSSSSALPAEPDASMLEGFGADTLDGLGDLGDGGDGIGSSDDISDLEEEFGLGSLGAGSDDSHSLMN